MINRTYTLSKITRTNRKDSGRF